VYNVYTLLVGIVLLLDKGFLTTIWPVW